MFGRGRSPATASSGSTARGSSGVDLRVEERETLLDIAYPLQQVRIRWHTLDGGEACVPGQIQTIDRELVEVWFNRNTPTYDPLHADDQIWLDVLSGTHAYVFAGWLIGMRPPDTLVILVKGLPRRDQRRQYVRERVDLPPQIALPLDGEGREIGALQEVVLLDLSGGGVRMELSEPVPEDAILQLTLDVGTGPIEILVKIVGSYRTVTGRQIVRGYFREINERSRRDVIRFIFREQLRKARLAPGPSGL